MHAGGGNCGRHSIDLTAKKEYDYEYEEGKLTRADECNIVLSGGRTISYEYDAEERITKVVDSVDGTTEYTYDALGQLLNETVNGLVVNTMSMYGFWCE